MLPPTLMMANFCVSTVEYCFRYCSTSLRVPRLRSRRTMTSLAVCMVPSGEQALVGGERLGEIGEEDPLARRVRLRDVAGAIDERVETGLGEERGLRPEVDRGAAREAEILRE